VGIGMRIGINGTGSLTSLDATVEAARRAEADGFDSFWIAQVFGLDALTALAVAGLQVPRIELGTAVVPTYPRHPMMLAGQALTVQAATAGRLTLGIGLSHQIVIENLWGYSYATPVRHMREYLDALLPLLRGEATDLHGEEITCVGRLEVASAAAPPVLVAALGSQMLRLTGARGCGTITWCTGQKALADHIVPLLTSAAEGAGHPAPRVVASLPVAVTTDPDGARALVADRMALYGGLPSYRAMLDIEGVTDPAEVAIIGDEAQVEAALRRMAESGVTDFGAAITTTSVEDHDRTWDLLRELRA
jgi:5,10-methylenetetrahydromethanopterin reductase